MEIYLKHRNRNQYVCLQRVSADSLTEIEVYTPRYGGNSVEFTFREDESIDECLKGFVSAKDHINYNGTDIQVNRWEPSSKVEFEVAYLSVKLEMQKFENSINL